MSDTGLAAFDSTLQKTNIWLGDVMEELRTTDRHRAYRALSATLHAVRDRLPPHALAELSAHLPMLLRGVLFEGWSPSDTHPSPRTVDAFLAPVQAAFRDEEVGYAEWSRAMLPDSSGVLVPMPTGC